MADGDGFGEALNPTREARVIPFLERAANGHGSAGAFHLRDRRNRKPVFHEVYNARQTPYAFKS